MSDIHKSKFRKWVSMKGFKGVRHTVNKDEAEEIYNTSEKVIRDKPRMENDDEELVSVEEVMKMSEDSINLEDELDNSDDSFDDMYDEVNLAEEEGNIEDDIGEFSIDEEEYKEELDNIEVEGKDDTSIIEEKETLKENIKEDILEQEVDSLESNIEEKFCTVSELLQIVENKEDRKEYNPALISLVAREKKKNKGINLDDFKVLKQISEEMHKADSTRWENNAAWLRGFAKNRKARPLTEDASFVKEELLKEFS